MKQWLMKVSKMRDYLAINEQLSFSKDYDFIIDKRLSEGSSVLVYLAHNQDNKPFIIKEYYPISDELIFEREDSILVSNNDERFDEYKTNFKQRIKALNDDINQIFKADELYNNFISTNIITLDYNNTVYLIQDYAYGEVYSDYQESSLEELLSNILAITKIVKKLHDKNYIAFDIKPSNLFLEKASDANKFSFIDFDSFLKVGEDYKRYKTTKEYAANDDIVTIKYDIYAIGTILKERLETYDLNNYYYRLADCLNKLIKQSLAPLFSRLNDDELIEGLNEAMTHVKIKSLLSNTEVNTDNLIVRKKELNKINDKLNKYHLAIISDVGGSGKRFVTYTYANSYRANYDTIQITNFNNSWEEVFLNLNYLYQDDLKYPNIKERAYDALSFHSPALLIVNDYNLDPLEDVILNQLLARGVYIILTSTNVYDNAIKLEPLNETAAIKIFSDNYPREIKANEINCVKEIVKQCGYLPALIKLHALSVIKLNLNSLAEYLDLLAKNGLKDNYIFYHNKIKSLYTHSELILKLNKPSEAGIKILNALYLFSNCAFKEKDLVSFNLDKLALIELEVSNIIRRERGNIDLNPCLKQYIFDNYLDSTKIDYKAFVNKLIKVDKANYILSFLANLKTDIEDYNLYFNVLYSKELLRRVDENVLDKCLDKMKKLNSFNYDEALMTLYERRRNYRELFKVIDKQNQNYPFDNSILEAYAFANAANAELQDGNMALYVQKLLAAATIFKRFPKYKLELYYTYFAIINACNAMGAYKEAEKYLRKFDKLCDDDLSLLDINLYLSFEVLKITFYLEKAKHKDHHKNFLKAFEIFSDMTRYIDLNFLRTNQDLFRDSYKYLIDQLTSFESVYNLNNDNTKASLQNLFNKLESFTNAFQGYLLRNDVDDEFSLLVAYMELVNPLVTLKFDSFFDKLSDHEAKGYNLKMLELNSFLDNAILLRLNYHPDYLEKAEALAMIDYLIDESGDDFTSAVKALYASSLILCFNKDARLDKALADLNDLAKQVLTNDRAKYFKETKDTLAMSHYLEQINMARSMYQRLRQLIENDEIATYRDDEKSDIKQIKADTECLKQMFDYLEDATSEFQNKR